jgi:hypothetical protein
MTLAFLAGCRPAIFGLAAANGPEPHCTTCGGAVGIFLGRANDWQHFRTGPGDGSRVEVYDADHAPTIGWRYATPPAPAVPRGSRPLTRSPLALLRVPQSHYLRESDSCCGLIGTESDQFWHKEKEVGLA